MSERDVLVVGNLRGASRSALTTAVSSLKLNLVEIANVDEATAALEKRPWYAVLIDTTLSGASRFCAEARSQRNLFGIPFIALSPRLTDLAFLNALRWGVDDVVALGATEPLSVRLGALSSPTPSNEGEPTRGDAVVADPDRRRANGLGRAIHTAGYAVRYATDTTSARFYTTKPDVELFILSAELTEPKAFIEQAQQSGCKARWVVLTKSAQTDELEKQLSGFKGVVVMSSGGPPENVLFAVNLLYPSEASRRGEIRALFGTVVFFRAVGDYRDECGFSYTASPQGLYVRTLAPPPSDKVWVELIPPDGERRVRLVGKVAWSRGYGRRPGEAAPPGFGVHIVDGLGEDLALWSECMKGLEFRAPATLVPEARFSFPAPAQPAPEGTRPTALTTSTASLRSPVSSANASLTKGRGASTLLGGALLVGQETTRPTSGRAKDEAEPAKLSVAPSLPQPPSATSIDRLSAAAKARISTRPSLRLSVPSPITARRDPLTKAGRLSRPPIDEKRPAEEARSAEATHAEPPAPSPPTPKRIGQGRTVMGLGILQRDGSLSFGPPTSGGTERAPGDAEQGDEAARHSLQPPTPQVNASTQQVNAPTPANDVTAARADTSTNQDHTPERRDASVDDQTHDERSSATRDTTLEAPSARALALRLSPVTGRTLSYGSEPPSVANSKFQAAADALPYPPDDISERPTLSDRFSLERAEQLAAQSLRPDATETFESLPPDALESDAPKPLDTRVIAPAPPRAFPFVSQPALDETPAVSALAETDRNWVGLDSIPPEHRLSNPPPMPAEAPVATSLGSDLGATLPGVVVDTVVSPKPPSTDDVSPSAEVEPRRPAISLDDTQLHDVAPQGDVSDDSSTYEFGKYRGPSTLPPAGSAEQAGVTPMRRALGPLVLAVAVAAGVIALMVRQKAPSLDVNVAAPAARGIEVLSPVPSEAAPANPPAPHASVQADQAPQVHSVEYQVETVPSALPPTPKPEQQAPTVTAAATTPATAPEAAEPNATTAANPPRDPSTLSAKNAWLYVSAPVSANVFIHGIESGATNTWLETACGTRFVRLGRAAGDWLSAGVPTVIRCRSANTIEVPVP